MPEWLNPVVNPEFLVGSRFDIREQALANARVLWPMVEQERIVSGRATSARALPSTLEVVITSHGRWCEAAIVHGGEIRNGEVAPQYIFVESQRFGSEREALYAVLTVTQVKLYKMWSENVQLAPGTNRYVDGKGYGAFFM
ncbi:uncharacterized protein RCC_05637 [Ramularia collo-cygni]|uniref:Uncharacterized protein n=1 Tax=Ramularia collo-cygni TaxID=112498 RepID=A0A2D3URK1_9PEZI|nr:uncharacterized protein RCC_05637 [Ramularia collo-cygni]CZT19782.1 uncharacterized protein RCC_05637 [Ramularia collo-cygni]